MEFVAGNIVRVARGARSYAAKPVLGRVRGFWELQWIVSGKARPTDLNQQVSAVNSPCLYISHPDSTHGWTDDPDGTSEIAVLHFRTAPAELLTVVKPTKTFPLALGAGDLRLHFQLLDEACDLQEARDLSWRLKFDQILLEVTLLAIKRAGAVVVDPAPADRVKQALHWFEENIGDNPSADDVAKAAGVTRGHLRRLFLEAGLNAPKLEFSRRRIALAQRCLVEGWKLERIAAYLGFSEASALSRSFSEVCGLSPRRWLITSPERARPRELS